MLQLLPVGVNAARVQAVGSLMISSIGFFVGMNPWLLGMDDLTAAMSSDVHGAELWAVIYQIVTWSELGLAVGLSLTYSKGFDTAVWNIKKASRLLEPRQPYLSRKTLASLLAMSALLCGLLALQIPISGVIESQLPNLASIVKGGSYSILMNTAVAYFGSSARAAFAALD